MVETTPVDAEGVKCEALAENVELAISVLNGMENDNLLAEHEELSDLFSHTLKHGNLSEDDKARVKEAQDLMAERLVRITGSDVEQRVHEQVIPYVEAA